MEELEQYRYCGHGVLMGRWENDWQAEEALLSFFGQRISAARMHYYEFVQRGIALGKRPELTGGGLIRSYGGWKALTNFERSGIHPRGDERILGDSDFVESVLERQNERLERYYRLRAKGYDLDGVVDRVSELLDISSDEILKGGKHPRRVRARSLVCYWAVKELGMNGTEIGKRLGMIQSAVSRAVQRGERFVLKNQYRLEK